MSNNKIYPLIDWYVDLRFITCNDDAITPTVHSTVHIEQTADHILKLYALLNRMPFLVRMTLTSVEGVPDPI